MKKRLSKRKGRRDVTLPRWAVPLVWAVLVLVIQVLLPWVVARVGPRFGWTPAAPGQCNFIGLIVVTVGLALYTWCLVFHFRSYDDSVRVSFSPPHLVAAGPYRLSRNPMYVSGLLTWIGWTIFYGSLAVFFVLVLLWAVFAFRVIPHEERQLEELFGEDYLRYKRSVHRWIGWG
ncbi:MAG: isoprenylcysteine carboxylmethyltransferase family protein [Anaerolineae bacterium]|jgi:protein-S-isoprenylcysteine O-methyltransferase Ste14